MELGTHAIYTIGIPTTLKFYELMTCILYPICPWFYLCNEKWNQFNQIAQKIPSIWLNTFLTQSQGVFLSFSFLIKLFIFESNHTSLIWKKKSLFQHARFKKNSILPSNSIPHLLLNIYLFIILYLILFVSFPAQVY